METGDVRGKEHKRRNIVSQRRAKNTEGKMGSVRKRGRKNLLRSANELQFSCTFICSTETSSPGNTSSPSRDSYTEMCKQTFFVEQHSSVNHDTTAVIRSPAEMLGLLEYDRITTQIVCRGLRGPGGSGAGASLATALLHYVDAIQKSHGSKEISTNLPYVRISHHAVGVLLG